MSWCFSHCSALCAWSLFHFLEYSICVIGPLRGTSHGAFGGGNPVSSSAFALSSSHVPPLLKTSTFVSGSRLSTHLLSQLLRTLPINTFHLFHNNTISPGPRRSDKPPPYLQCRNFRIPFQCIRQSASTPRDSLKRISLLDLDLVLLTSQGNSLPIHCPEQRLCTSPSRLPI